MARHYLATLTIGLFGLLASVAPGNATEVVFTSTGSCGGSCANVGVAAGDTFSVMVGMDSSALVDGAQLDGSDLLNFSMNAGSIVMTQDNTFELFFTGIYHAATHDIDDVEMNASAALTPAFGDTAILQGSELLATAHGNCDHGCDAFFLMQPATTQNMTALTAPVASAPEPAAWAMLLAGFAAVGASIRQRRLLTV
jgi:hypothetical protein